VRYDRPMHYETPMMGRPPGGNEGTSRYFPISIGQSTATSCPSRSYWWLVFAAGLGAFAGWQFSAEKRRKRGRP
jgi:hypothetical protein